MPRSVTIIMISDKHCVRCPYLEVFWSVFSSIRTEYGPEKLEYGQLSRNDKFIKQLKTQLRSHDLPQNSQFSRGFSG